VKSEYWAAGGPTAAHAPAPARIGIAAGGELDCPWHGRISIDRCRTCRFVQGTLEEPEVEILCGFGHGAPLRHAVQVPADPAPDEPR